MKRLILGLPLLAALGCASAPRPRVLSDVELVAKTAGAQSAAARAPEAFAHAEKLRKDANAAYARDDAEGAQLLAERAIAAYEHAQVLARAARARERLLEARTALSTTERKLADVEAEQQRAAADADALELRIQVVRDAAPIAASGPADNSREAARQRAARSLALDARLLCAAARLLRPGTASLASAESAADELDKRLTSAPRPAPIDAAMRARASCLTALTEARRPANAVSSFGRSDQLLAELSAMGGLEPTRDERGVVVTLRAKTADLGEREARDRLARLARVAQAHPAFPLEVVVHDEPGASPAAAPSASRADQVVTSLQAAGVAQKRIWTHAAGTAHPLSESPARANGRRNERIEIVFVDPGG